MKRSRVNLFIVQWLFLLGLFLALQSCSNEDDPQPDKEEEEEEVEKPVDTFPGPTYSDNYTPYASWSSRGQWNLANVHDPSVAKDGEYYYMYQTDASYGNAHEGHGHFPYRRSKDLINWEYLGAALSEAPDWVKDSLNNKRARIGLEPIENPSYGYWAPYILKFGEVYRLYYSIVVTDLIVANATSWTERAFIGMAESTDLASNVWEDKGMVICSEPDGKETFLRSNTSDWSAYFQFNAIDPTVSITPEGDHWLIYGSWHTGIAAVELDPTTGKPFQLEKLEDYGVRIAGRGNISTNRWQAMEGPEIMYNENTGYYYLFVAYDELSVAYNTRVARSKNILGPYETITGESVTGGAECWPMLTHPYSFKNHTGWVGFSHCSVFQDPDTKEWFYSSQARLPEGVPGINVSNAVMMGHVREIKWTEDGWPVLAPERFAGVPDTTLTQADMAGLWEQITMEYQYQTIQNSGYVTLGSDGSVKGELSGTWSFDAASNTITVGGVKCQVFEAWDWEALPRRRTITYSGLTSSGKPVWGKKVD
ncbi:arabinan endo-1,5-alpha-L-arabinosidase [Flammeovirgaceae bacterium SG7u.132]|nr:arabinan endo-1,5-alpha-L-arabinosidase [Flammeovirgaceae bacterium SG7u.132]